MWLLACRFDYPIVRFEHHANHRETCHTTGSRLLSAYANILSCKKRAYVKLFARCVIQSCIRCCLIHFASVLRSRDSSKIRISLRNAAGDDRELGKEKKNEGKNEDNSSVETRERPSGRRMPVVISGIRRTCVHGRVQSMADRI